MLKGFKQFALRGNVIDMAVGIVIGAAFGKIVTSFVNDILMPPIGMMLGNVDFSDLVLTLQAKTQEMDAITINYGAFINNILDFIIVAFAIFIVVNQVNKLHKKKEQVSTTKECPKCCSKIPLKASKCAHCTSEVG